jgi:hypothetical protein
LMNEDSVEFIKVLPRQLPVGVSEKKVQTFADNAANGTLILIILQLIFQFFFKSKLDQIFALFNALTIMCYLNICDIQSPAFVEIILV